ncbi:MAG: oxygen-independent coproporphyrinogen III oxidase [Aquificae bacterium]|nr:oxygen-independent coproporphyrinogen III oxidase [Aquificota bacterium]
MSFLPQDVKFDMELIKKYDKPAPRYTSYPTAAEFSQEVNHEIFTQKVVESNQRKSPLSLYFHIPFCESACHFCACNVIISRRKEVVEPYLEYLFKELEKTSSFLDENRKVVQYHWGGGTPNYMDKNQMESLFKKSKQLFDFDKDAEISIEIDPRYIDKEGIFFLRELGFNRLSFGIQDFDPKVQKAVNRIQPEDMIFNIMKWTREAGFESVNIDLIYGLPYQTLETFTDTVEKTIKLNPDRIAVFNFAYVPWLKPLQRNIIEEALPPAQEKLDILKMTIEKLTNAGYVFIGMDHFAKPNDELAVAQRERTLHRNFQGYTTKAGAELFGFGATSISMLHDVYAQNYKKIRDYYNALDKNIIPISRGVLLNEDDIIRRDVIMKLMCHFRLIKDEIQRAYNIDFDEYFKSELEELKQLEQDGLINIYPDRIDVTPAGRLLIRNIAVIFDIYTKAKKEQKFSKAI